MTSLFLFALFWGSDQITSPMPYDYCKAALEIAVSEQPTIYAYCLPVEIDLFGLSNTLRLP